MSQNYRIGCRVKSLESSIHVTTVRQLTVCYPGRPEGGSISNLALSYLRQNFPTFSCYGYLPAGLTISGTIPQLTTRRSSLIPHCRIVTEPDAKGYARDSLYAIT